MPKIMIDMPRMIEKMVTPDAHMMLYASKSCPRYYTGSRQINRMAELRRFAKKFVASGNLN